MKAVHFNFQKNTDVVEVNADVEQAITTIVQDLVRGTPFTLEWAPTPLSPSSVLSHHARQAAQVSNIKGIPFDEVEDEHFENLEKAQAAVPPILISNMVDNIPEEFNEVGIGEGNISVSEEDVLLSESIQEKISMSTLSNPSKDLLLTVLQQNKNALGLKQSNAQMSLMTPITVTLKPGSRVLRSDGYHLAPEQEDFLELKFKALQDAGIVEPAKNPIWGHPVFVVPKKMAKPEGWAAYSNAEKEKWKTANILNRHRMVSNMIRLNRITVPTSLNLPNLERQLLSVKGSKIYATLDILSGFDFLETEESSKDIFTLVTRRSAWRLRGAPMGWMNTPALFCDRVVNEVVDGIEKLFGRRTNGVICWLDDLLVYAESEQKLIDMLKLLFIQAAKMRVRFNLRKCDFAVSTTIWCGRQVKNGYWNFSPTFYEKVLSMEKPRYRHQVAQIVYLANWLSPNIPKLAELRKPFAHFANLEGKKLVDIEKLKEEVQWTDELEDAYSRLKSAIVEASKRFLAAYDSKSPLLLFTDSSYDVWSMAIFQDEHKNISNDIRTLAPKPLMFLSGTFTASELRWHIASKELYPIIYAFERVGFLLRTHPGGLFVYTDHRALLSILRVKENEKRIYWDRLYRWAIRLQSVDLTVFHIPSRDNFVSDLLTRWAVESKPLVARVTMGITNSLVFHEDAEDDIVLRTDLEDTDEAATPTIAQLSEGSGFGLQHFDEVDFEDIDEGIKYESSVSRLFYTPEETVEHYCARLSSGGGHGDQSRQPDHEGSALERPHQTPGSPRWVNAVDETIPSDIHSIVEELFTEHISYLSPFYYGKWSHLHDKVIAKHQAKLPEEFKQSCEAKDELLYFQGKLVVPRTVAARFIVINHTAKAHPSRRAEMLFLKEVYFHGIQPKDLKLLIRSFRKRCLHCQREPSLIRRPYKLTPLARRIREIIRSDYLYINSTGYLLVLLDSCSRKVMLQFAEKPTAENMSNALLRWRADLGFAEQFCIITDNGSHFANQLMQKLATSIGFEQTFTVAYSPWSNGSVETINSQILKLFRSLTSQFGLYEKEWPKLVPVISYILNNRPSPRRAGFTPNEIFLNLKLATPLIMKSRKFFAIQLKDDLACPEDVGRLLEHLDELRQLMDDKQEAVYNAALLQRQAELERRNRSRGLIIQYAPGDYVMVSEQGTQEATSKIKLTWLGPYQVVRILSQSVYEVESILGKRKVVHGSRIWFYGSRPPTMHPKLKSLFTHNLKELEVEKIRKIRLTDGPEAEYEVLIRWRGFEASRDTWQSLNQLYEDLPLMVRNFVESRLADSSMKNNILKELDILDERRLAVERSKNVSKRRKAKKKGGNRVSAIKKPSYFKVWNAIKRGAERTKGWFNEEKEVLRALILKHGCGNYEAYLQQPYLPNRSKQQLSSQIQRLLGLQSIGIFHGKHFQVDKARLFLESNFGIKGFHKNLPGRLNLLKEKEELLKQFDVEVLATEEEIESAEVPYFRRLDNPEHIRLMLQEFDEQRCQTFLEDTPYTTRKELHKLLQEYEADRISVLQDSEKDVENCYVLMLNNEECWLDLSRRYSAVTSILDPLHFHEESDPPTTYQYNGKSLTLQYKSRQVELSYLDLSSDNNAPLRLIYSGGNLFSINGGKSTIYLEPPKTKIMFGNVFDLIFDHPAAKKNIYTLVVMDPPWTVGTGNPTRGVSLPYPTVSNANFARLNLPLNHFPFGTFLFVWVTNHSFGAVLDWAHDQNFYLSDDVCWMKMHRSGNLHKSIGYFLQHSQETCLVFERRTRQDVVYQNTFEEDNLLSFSNYFYGNPLTPSVKHEEFYRMLEETFPTRHAIEYFGRWNNIRMNWTTCGLDLTSPAHLSFFQHSRAGTN
eukprot:snap_masked-scaffold_21-processed-gene-5.42-mRNA-1 protein AED:0.45 eAED:0.45 QI:0/-1/0/1/-1/1/1/0/1856